MDTREELAIIKIEKRMRAQRDPSPCDDYQEVNNVIDPCGYCGWDEKDHPVKRARVAQDKSAAVPPLNEGQAKDGGPKASQGDGL